MANIAELEDVLSKIEATEGIHNAVIVSRSGMHIAGDVPQGAHTETFVAMSAILLGAAETATSEIKEKLGYVIISLEQSEIYIQTISQRGILVMRVSREIPNEQVHDLINTHMAHLENNL